MCSLRSVLVVAASAALLAASGCGGDSEGGGGEAAEAPTQVTVADLRKDGTFWKSLTPDLKDELADLCKTQLGDRRAKMSGEPTVSNRIESIPTAEVVIYVDKQYTNEAKVESLITINCGGAIDANIGQQLDEAVSDLGTYGE
ncbi:MAG: hypothetical protein ACSLFR_00560 [Solirubrobacteraceae bacterium]